VFSTRQPVSLPGHAESGPRTAGTRDVPCALAESAAHALVGAVGHAAGCGRRCSSVLETKGGGDGGVRILDNIRSQAGRLVRRGMAWRDASRRLRCARARRACPAGVARLAGCRGGRVVPGSKHTQASKPKQVGGKQTRGADAGWRSEANTAAPPLIVEPVQLDALSREVA
jgi:hypothetical protein